MDLREIKVLENLRSKRQLEPYINHIRFPKYRNLEKGLRIDFEFPITALVGPNGTNKSSILRAVYSCPDGYSLGEFWFSTAIDPIDEEGGRSRFIYGYYHENYGEIVEAIKTRIKRSHLKNKKEINPDYWEPSRPILADGMDKMPEYKNGDLGRTKTRWNLIDKNVVFLDFRSEISAVDKYFYHGDLNKTLKHQTKQEYLREKSKYIRQAIDENLESKKMYKGKKEHIFKNVVLDEYKVEKISTILGKELEEVRIIEHKFFSSRGHSVMFKTNKHHYSEAAAGSGEFAIAMQVYKVLEAPKKSLIIFDEPEVSLHPGAQEKLIEFLFEQVKEKKHQVVIGTHSPHILKHLPRKAIKSLYVDYQTNEIKATNETSHDAAFYNIGFQESGLRKTIFVEDRLAREIVLLALRKLGEAAAKSVNVRYMPGGSSVLLNQYLVPLALIDKRDCLFVLDGDEERSGVNAIPESVINLDEEELDKELISLFGSTLSYKTDGGDSKQDKAKQKEQREEQKKKTLDFCKTNLCYLPGKVVPEQFIWDNMDSELRSRSNTSDLPECFKERFKLLAATEYGKEPWEEISGDEIFEVQRRCLSTVPKETLGDLMNFINGQ